MVNDKPSERALELEDSGKVKQRSKVCSNVRFHIKLVQIIKCVCSDVCVYVYMWVYMKPSLICFYR